MEDQIKPCNLNAEAFVRRLLDEGSKNICDETSESFKTNEGLPPFYDEKSYKRAQKFFIDNIFALFYGKFLGLLTILAIPSIRRVLVHTKMSGSQMSAYRRYLATVFHMCIWYKEDFAPGSKLWQSIEEVKNKHASASKKCSLSGLGGITQMDMALTQFGFMGFALARREKIGLHNVNDEDLKSFVHLWRVVGFLMGIEDRFNICRESLEETVSICRELSSRVFKPAVEKKDKEFLDMATYLAEGMWAMNPCLDTKVFVNLAYRLLGMSENNNFEEKERLLELGFWQGLWYKVLVYTIISLKFTVFRLYHNYVQFIALWLMKVFPFLAYYSFGYRNSYVRVLEESSKSQ